jgi:hypothetical protein
MVLSGIKEITERALGLLHDSELDRVMHSRSTKTLRLRFDLMNGKFAEFFFNDVLAYRIDGMRDQNVVSKIVVSTTSPIPHDELRRVLVWISSSPEGHFLVSEELLARHLSAVISGELRIFHLDPSCGAEVGVVCRSTSLSQRDDP